LMPWPYPPGGTRVSVVCEPKNEFRRPLGHVAGPAQLVDFKSGPHLSPAAVCVTSHSRPSPPAHSRRALVASIRPSGLPVYVTGGALLAQPLWAVAAVALRASSSAGFGLQMQYP
jgi:hypothetical protein